MSKRLPNPRRVKIHYSYTVEEVARLLGVHKNTVRSWIKQGLPLCDDRRPMLIVGHALVAFLTAKRAATKRPCRLDEIYCVRCRRPQVPAGRMADFQAKTERVGSLSGICSSCESLIFRTVSTRSLPGIVAQLEVLIVSAVR